TENETALVAQRIHLAGVHLQQIERLLSRRKQDRLQWPGGLLRNQSRRRDLGRHGRRRWLDARRGERLGRRLGLGGGRLLRVSLGQGRFHDGHGRGGRFSQGLFGCHRSRRRLILRRLGWLDGGLLGSGLGHARRLGALHRSSEESEEVVKHGPLFGAKLTVDAGDHFAGGHPRLVVLPL